MRWKDYLDKIAFEDLGLKDHGGPAQDEQDLLMFDRNDARLVRIREQRAWFSGDDAELLNFYAKNTAINFHIEPFYWKNKRSYFWSESSKENDYKRTTSGLAPAIIWSIINIIGFPFWSENSEDEKGGTGRLEEILEDDNFDEVFHEEMMPKTMSEGSGCLKISWDLQRWDHPTIDFVSAENVDFIRRGRHIVGVAFRDWYVDKQKRRYMVAEIRRIVLAQGEGEAEPTPHLIINTRAFRATEGDDCELTPIDGEFRNIPELRDVPQDVDVSNCRELLAVPCWFWKDPEGIMDGKPMLMEKVSLLDDLDQSLSQSSNADRATTVQRVYDTQFLDRDPETQLPIRPDKFNLKYTYTDSGPTADANGGIKNTVPINVIQPQVNFDQYTSEQMNIVTHILQGLVSPATMGIDVSRKDNADAQREKEKITVFTRNGMIRRLEKMLRSLARQVLVCDDYIHGRGMDWSLHKDIGVKFSEFADTSFESRAQTLVQMMGTNAISPKQYIKRLYLDTLTKDEIEEEIDWLNSHFSAEAQQQAMLGGAAGEADPAGGWMPQNAEEAPEELPAVPPEGDLPPGGPIE